MAGYFKKRRGKDGPSKNERKVMRNEQARAQVRRAGVLSERFPTVRGLSMRFVFLDRSERVLNEELMVFKAGDSAVFGASCPGRCGQSEFNFIEALEKAVLAGAPICDSTALCAGVLYGSVSEPCGCKAMWHAEIDYNPAPVDAKP